MRESAEVEEGLPLLPQAPEQVRAALENRENIRNIAFIGRMSHGKTSLVDSLVAASGLFPPGKAGEMRFTDTRQDEQERCMSIKSTVISLYYNELPAAIQLPESTYVQSVIEIHSPTTSHYYRLRRKELLAECG